MTGQTQLTPIQAYARLAGAIYLVIIVFGGYAEGVVMSKLVVSGDATATMRNILTSSDQWNLSAMINLIVPVLAVFQLWIEAILFRPVSTNLTRLFVLLNIANICVESVSKIFLLMVMPILHGAGLAEHLDQSQVFALAGLALKAHDIGFSISLIFFGAVCLVEGYLILSSGFLPRALGVLMSLAGVAYLAMCFSQLFAPAILDLITPAVFAPILIGEGSLCLWLLIKGVDAAKWGQLAGEDRSSTH